MNIFAEAHLLDYIVIAILALTGALVAAEKEMDIFGFILLGTVTGIGGGTLRDVMLGIKPIFWIDDPVYVEVCMLASALTFFIAHWFHARRFKLLLRFDAIGLAGFAVSGAKKALLVGASPLVAIIMRVVTATFGGIIRDILSGEVPLILRKEIYVTAAFAGVTLFVVLAYLPQTRDIAALAGFFCALLIRLAAIQFGWSFPAYKRREL